MWYGNWKVLGVLGVTVTLIATGIFLAEHLHKPLTHSKRETAQLTDLCVTQYGGLVLDYEEGTATTYQ